MIRARVAPRARRDLRAAVDWIHARNPAAAATLIDAIDAATQLLAARPGLGHRRPTILSDRYRFWRVRGFPYLIIYTMEEIPPLIVRILHTSRNLPPELADLDD